jgi:hypothetical protein
VRRRRRRPPCQQRGREAVHPRSPRCLLRWLAQHRQQRNACVSSRAGAAAARALSSASQEGHHANALRPRFWWVTRNPAPPLPPSHTNLSGQLERGLGAALLRVRLLGVHRRGGVRVCAGRLLRLQGAGGERPRAAARGIWQLRGHLSRMVQRVPVEVTQSGLRVPGPCSGPVVWRFVAAARPPASAAGVQPCSLPSPPVRTRVPPRSAAAPVPVHRRRQPRGHQDPHDGAGAHPHRRGGGPLLQEQLHHLLLRPLRPPGEEAAPLCVCGQACGSCIEHKPAGAARNFSCLVAEPCQRSAPLAIPVLRHSAAPQSKGPPKPNNPDVYVSESPAFSAYVAQVRPHQLLSQTLLHCPPLRHSFGQERIACGCRAAARAAPQPATSSCSVCRSCWANRRLLCPRVPTLGACHATGPHNTSPPSPRHAAVWRLRDGRLQRYAHGQEADRGGWVAWGRGGGAGVEGLGQRADAVLLAQRNAAPNPKLSRPLTEAALPVALRRWMLRGCPTSRTPSSLPATTRPSASPAATTRCGWWRTTTRRVQPGSERCTGHVVLGSATSAAL